MKKLSLALMLSFIYCIYLNIASFADQNNKKSDNAIDLLKYNFTQGDYATGTWHSARTIMEEHGISINVDYTSDAFSKLTGGFNNKFKARYQGLVNFAVTFDTDKMGLWKGGTLFVMGENVHGQGLSASVVGDFQYLSSIDVPRTTHLGEFWYSQYFINDRLRIKFGKQDANCDFDAIDSGFGFVNSSFQLNPTIPMPTYTAQGMGVMLSAAPFPYKDISIKAGIYDGVPTGQFGFKSALDGKDGCFIIVEPEIKYSFKNYSGKVYAGYWFHSGNVDEMPAGPDISYVPPPGIGMPVIEPRVILSNQGTYLGLEQMLFKEQKELEDTQGLTLLAKFGYAPPNRNEISRFFGVGLSYQGLLPKRNDDTANMGIVSADFSGRLKTTDSRTIENAMEISYQAQITKWLTLQPMFQLIFNPNGHLKDACVLGLRTIINF